ncbi:MAG: hypothetical protein J2P19_13670 [Pseudonocardia sp.]|nr:hypothetical protein [Pseudonocardia sp.]
MNVPGQQPSQVSGQMSGPLTEILAQGPVPIDTVVRWGAQLARELAGAHEVGRVHGDVRADVVAVGVDGAAHLSGFNEPRTKQAAHPAPELVQGGVPTRAADVFALGAVLYEAGGGAEPRLMPLWADMGQADPAQRPSAAQVAERLEGLGKKRSRRSHKAFVITGIAVVVVAAVIAGVTFYTGIWPVNSRSAAPRSEWRDPIGDLRTVDPCALLDTNAMQRFGATRLYPDLNTFTACAMEIRLSANEQMYVTVSLNNPAADDSDLANTRTQRIGALSLYLGDLYKQDENSNACQRFLLLPNRFRVTLYASAATATRPDSLCGTADAAAQIAARILNRSELPRRNVTGPSNSLLWVDACALLDDAALHTVPGLNTARRDRSQGFWSCKWGGDPQVADPPTVSIYMGHGPETTGEATTVGGRAALMDKNRWDGESVGCRIAMTQRSYRGTYDEPRTEVLFVAVHLNAAAPPDAQCAAATTIAGAVVAKLPPPS